MTHSFMLVTNLSPGLKQAPNPMCFSRRNVETPYSPLRGTACRKACLWQCGIGMSEEANAGL